MDVPRHEQERPAAGPPPRRGRLVLSRKKGDRVAIGSDIVVTVAKIGESHIWLGVDAPRDVGIFREEALQHPRR